VRWKQCLHELEDFGVTGYAELGPGGVLTGMAKRTVSGARTISIATPEELDDLIEWMSDESTSGPVRLEGEYLFASERLVVSPAAGIFTPTEGIGEGSAIEVGSVLGHVGQHEVRSPFAGTLLSYIALDTERVTARQPIAWLRTS
jgi:[acyl-carrier-protein] S-malonyltransferase